jgi:predicted ABC-type ATPase
MEPTLCIIGGCNGAGKTTLAPELLPRMGIECFLNADEIARGLSPLNPSLTAFQAGRLLLQEVDRLVRARASFAIESTLSGRSHVRWIRVAKAQGFRVILHYLMIGSATQTVERVKLRVLQGGHGIPEMDIRRRFAWSRTGLFEHYLVLADAWGVWDNSLPPPRCCAHSQTHSIEALSVMLESSKLMDEPTRPHSEMARMVLEAGRVATEKMLEHYRRHGIKVTPQLTLAEEDDSPTED